MHASVCLNRNTCIHLYMATYWNSERESWRGCERSEWGEGREWESERVRVRERERERDGDTKQLVTWHLGRLRGSGVRFWKARPSRCPRHLCPRAERGQWPPCKTWTWVCVRVRMKNMQACYIFVCTRSYVFHTYVCRVRRIKACLIVCMVQVKGLSECVHAHIVPI